MITQRLVWPAEYYQAVVSTSPAFRFISHNPGYRALRELLPALLRPGMRVLDIGCGIGVGAAHLVASGAHGVEYVGIDPDEAACVRAREILAGLPPERLRGTVVVQRIEDYVETRPEPFDLALWVYAFHEAAGRVDAPRQAALVRAVAGLLKPGAALVVVEPFFAAGATPEEIERAYAYIARIVGHDDHGKFIPRERMLELFGEEAGLRLVGVRERPNLFLTRYQGMTRARLAVLVFATPVG